LAYRTNIVEDWSVEEISGISGAFESSGFQDVQSSRVWRLSGEALATNFWPANLGARAMIEGCKDVSKRLMMRGRRVE
jgi:hypothetical protein